MKRFVSRMFNSLPKRLAAAAVITLAVLLPVSSMAADTIRMEGSLGVANVTAGDNNFKPAVNASYDQVVKLQVYYHNQENPDSGKIAENVRVKIAIPTAPGKTQVAHSTVKADNSNQVDSQSTINLDRDDAYLQYIPGSAVWKHNVGSNEAPQYKEEVISDAVVTDAQGMVVESAKPCFNFAATITVLARVHVPGVKINKQVRVKGVKDWASENTAKPGDTLEYLITYENAGNSEQKNVVIRDNLPPKMTYVPGTTYLANKTNPGGAKYDSDLLPTTGIVIGNYGPGANAFIRFDVKVPSADQMICGITEFRNVGVVRPESMSEHYNTAITKVNKVCASTPSYTCKTLEILPGNNRTVKISKFEQTTANGATFKHAVVNWGDGSAALTTNNVVGQSHQYAKDGNYTVSAVAYFTADNKEVSSASASCAKPVSFSSTKPPVTPPTTPTEIPSTGAGNLLAVFAATAIGGAVAFRVFMARRLGLDV